jgi:opacity protein-like surface antigen
MRKIYFLLLLILPVIGIGQAPDDWKRYRYEIIANIGVSNFLGDLGGANQIGTHYFRDLEFSETRFALGVGLRYKFTPRLAMRYNFNYGTVAGDDALTGDPARHNRNLSFRSRIYELSGNFEAAFLKDKGGHKYRLHNIIGDKGYEIYSYVFIGLGFFHYNPQAEYQGKWYDLQPLGTEGEGIAPGVPLYSLWQFSIPIGIGFKYSFDKQWGIGLEYGIRKTFTDYIDDVSNNYYSPEAIKSANGPLAAALANRTGEINGNQSWVTPGNMRGQPQYKDSYMFLTLNVNYKIKRKRSNDFFKT